MRLIKCKQTPKKVLIYLEPVLFSMEKKSSKNTKVLHSRMLVMMHFVIKGLLCTGMYETINIVSTAFDILPYLFG